MQGLHKEIFELQNRIKENDAKINQKLADLGRIIIKSNPDQIANTVLNEVFCEIHKLNKVEPQKRNDILSIQTIEGNLFNTRARIKEKKKELAEQEKETRQHLRNIGEAAYNVYKDNQELNEAFKNIFFDLISIDEKLVRNNQGRKDFKEVTQLDRKDNILKQFVNIAKSIFYEKKQDILVSRQSGLYSQIGRKVMDSEFLKINEDQVLNELAIPLNAILARIEKVKQEVTNLVEDEKKIVQNLLELGVRGNSAKRIKEIEDEIVNNQKIIDAKYQELGGVYNAGSRDLKIEFPGTAEIVSIVKMLFSENDGYKDKIKKLNARIEIQNIKEKILKNNKLMDGLKIKIDKEKEDIATLARTNSDYETEINRIKAEYKLEN